MAEKKYNNHNMDYSIEMIMLDEENNRIQSNCLTKWCDLFERYFTEGQVLIIKNPTLGQNAGNWKYISNPIKVCMNRTTEVQICNNRNGQLHGLCFQDFQSIIDLDVDATSSVDIIGMVIKCNQPQSYAKNDDGTDKIIMNIGLQDTKGRKIWITLFEDYAQQVIQYITNESQDTQVAIVLQFAKFSVYKERHSISNSFGISKLFVNSDIDEIHEMKKSYNESVGDIVSSTVGQLSSSIGYSLDKDFLVDTEFNHIAELNVIDEVKKVVILGTIKCFLEGSGWFYFSYKACNRIVEREVNNNVTSTTEDFWIYKCRNESCGGKKIEGSSRFKILIKVQDASGVVTLILFDKEARKLLKTSSADLLEKYVDDGKFPVELETLFERRLAMKIEVSKFNLENDYRFYTISTTTDNHAIISALDNKHNKEQSILSESINYSSQDFGEQLSTFKKDVGSLDNDRDTPLNSVDVSDKRSNTKCQSTSELSYTALDLKRKLNDIYDVEDGAASSPSKALFEGESRVREISHENLVVPKVEK